MACIGRGTINDHLGHRILLDSRGSWSESLPCTIPGSSCLYYRQNQLDRFHLGLTHMSYLIFRLQNSMLVGGLCSTQLIIVLLLGLLCTWDFVHPVCTLFTVLCCTMVVGDNSVSRLNVWAIHQLLTELDKPPSGPQYNEEWDCASGRLGIRPSNNSS